ncbi:MAG TPA: hypothetical protein VN578_06720 [Candidatus Binatia bacterium]|nr:hypothetical protein [Candidatus Binatia bacterium]
MTHEEQTILDFLGSSRETYFARKEIARRAVKRQVYEENQHWANAPLASLLDRGIVEQNQEGRYRLK